LQEVWCKYGDLNFFSLKIWQIWGILQLCRHFLFVAKWQNFTTKKLLVGRKSEAVIIKLTLW
jgi:hypothetical protein